MAKQQPAPKPDPKPVKAPVVHVPTPVTDGPPVEVLEGGGILRKNAKSDQDEHPERYPPVKAAGRPTPPDSRPVPPVSVEAAFIDEHAASMRLQLSLMDGPRVKAAREAAEAERRKRLALALASARERLASLPEQEAVTALKAHRRGVQATADAAAARARDARTNYATLLHNGSADELTGARTLRDTAEAELAAARAVGADLAEQLTAAEKELASARRQAAEAAGAGLSEAWNEGQKALAEAAYLMLPGLLLGRALCDLGGTHGRDEMRRALAIPDER